MKNFCIILFFILMSTCPVFSDEAIIQNSDFEIIDEGLPHFWSYIGWFKPEVKFLIDPDKYRTGSHSASIIIYDMTERLKGFGPPNWAQDIVENIPRGKQIRLIGYISADNVDGIAIIALQCLDDRGKLTGFGTTQYKYPISGTTDWTMTEFDLNVPENTSLMRVLCMLSGTGQAWFDNIDISIIADE